MIPVMLAYVLRQVEMSKREKYPKGLKSIGDFVRWGASRFVAADLFFGHGTDNAHDEALLLVTHALNLPPDCDTRYWECRIDKRERRAVAQLLMQRVESRWPAAYLTGSAWFAGVEFEVSDDVLVPRSPIGELIARHFSPWVEQGSVTRIMDLCTGSGCIAIACALAFPDAAVSACDIDSAALRLAERNIARHQVSDQVTLRQSDLFDGYEKQSWDLIVSNPPYVDSAEMAALPPEFQCEPALGLAGGEDGLDIVLRILADASRHLTERGILVVEVGHSQAALEKLLPALSLTWLDFEHGGSGVFAIDKAALVDSHQTIMRAKEERDVS